MSTDVRSEATRAVSNGQAERLPLLPRVNGCEVEHTGVRTFDRLSLSERLMLEMLSGGYTWREVGREMKITREILESARAKLKAKTTMHLVAMYVEVRQGAHIRVKKLRQRMVKRIRVMAASSFRCAYCDKDFLSDTSSFASVTFDHVTPKSRGGEDTEENLVACCGSCNSIKGDAKAKSVEDGRETVAQRLKEFELWLHQARAIRDGLDESPID